MAITPKSRITIPRQSVVGSEGLWTKMFDPPRFGPTTPDNIDLKQLSLAGPLRPNPVPSVMQAVGLYKPGLPYTVNRTLMHSFQSQTWDNGASSGAANLNWYLFSDAWLDGPPVNDFRGKSVGPSSPQYPAPTYRAPRGAVCHNMTDCGGPPPHTIHWHGIEPTPMNDGVGHCSFEVEGSYIYQWQPNFIGTYFYHCHRNTMMHFEYGLLGIMPFMPPDAWFANILTDGNGNPLGPGGVPFDPKTGVVEVQKDANGHLLIPMGAGRDGLFRTAANLASLPAALLSQFNFQPGDPIQGVNVKDPWTGDPFLNFGTDPHAYTVAFDVEAIWVVDDRSSEWSLGTKNPFQTFPVGATTGGTSCVIGVNENFHGDGSSLTPTASNDFFGFNDFNADYWFITGVPVAGPWAPASPGFPASPPVKIPTGLTIPPVLNSGFGYTGDPLTEKPSQISIRAHAGDTVFVRCLCAAYNSARVTFPAGLDVIIIEWDGRAMGVPPLNSYSRPHVLPKNADGTSSVTHSTARRWGAIFKAPAALAGQTLYATVDFLDTRSGQGMSLTGGGTTLMQAAIPIEILP